MPIGDGIRRNIKSVEPTEREALRDALIELNHRFFPDARTDTPARGGVRNRQEASRELAGGVVVGLCDR